MKMSLFGKPTGAYVKSSWFSSQNNFILNSVELLEGKGEGNSTYRYGNEQQLGPPMPNTIKIRKE